MHLACAEAERNLSFAAMEFRKREGVIPATSECCKFPIYECKVLENWEETGISPVYVSRELTKDSYVFISYLVDFWCLGVKDTILKFGVSKRDLSHIYNKSDDLVTISYQDARSLILGAIDFPKAIDIAPHSSWNGIPSSFIEAHLAYEKKFSFGQEERPHYVSGPNDCELYNVEEVVKKGSKAHGNDVVHISA